MSLTQHRLPTIALSVRQPWAWAIVHAGKNIENRSVGAVRAGRMGPGRIAIHASKGMTQDEYEEGAQFMLGSMDIICPCPDELVRGAIIGHVTVTDIVSESKSPWFFGERGLVLADPIAVDPIPAKGALGFFKWKATGQVDAPKPWMERWPPRIGPMSLVKARLRMLGAQ